MNSFDVLCVPWSACGLPYSALLAYCRSGPPASKADVLREVASQRKGSTDEICVLVTQLAQHVFAHSSKLLDVSDPAAELEEARSLAMRRLKALQPVLNLTAPFGQDLRQKSSDLLVSWQSRDKGSALVRAMKAEFNSDEAVSILAVQLVEATNVDKQKDFYDLASSSCCGLLKYFSKRVVSADIKKVASDLDKALRNFAADVKVADLLGGRTKFLSGVKLLQETVMVTDEMQRVIKDRGMANQFSTGTDRCSFPLFDALCGHLQPLVRFCLGASLRAKVGSKYFLAPLGPRQGDSVGQLNVRF